jgi:hypothetical protein
MGSLDLMREQIQARISELRLELAKCDQLMGVLDQDQPAAKPSRPAKAKAGTTAVLKAKRATTESEEDVVEDVTEPEAAESKAKAAATRNGGDSSKRKQIEHLLDEGLKPKEIAEMTGLQIGYIYSIKREHSPGR